MTIYLAHTFDTTGLIDFRAFSTPESAEEYRENLPLLIVEIIPVEVLTPQNDIA